MTVEEFAERYNQEFDWNREVFDEKFIDSHPFIKLELDHYMPKYKITPETCDYSTAKIFENGAGTDNHNFELQIYSREDYHNMYFWIHPDCDEYRYKSRIIKSITREVRAIKSRLKDERDEINCKLKEIHEFVNFIEKQSVPIRGARISR